MNRLDNDLYNFTMSQFIWTHFPDVNVEYQFINRTPAFRVLKEWDSVNRAMEDLQGRVVTGANMEVMEELDLFDPIYLDHIREWGLPFACYGQHLGKPFVGTWADMVFWETHILSAVSETFYKSICDDNVVWKIGEDRLLEKVKWLKEHQEIKFFEFGTRRRYSYEWQQHVLEILQEELPDTQFLGTSNILMGSNLDLPVRGTMAHQLFMVASALDGPVVGQQNIMEKWGQMWATKWDGSLLVALTDTYGTDFFLDHVDPAQVNLWKGFRQDSGNAIGWLYKIHKWCKRNDVSLEDKIFVFSDGLDIKQMLVIHNYASTIGLGDQVRFGWGTNLTNDMGLPPISIVVKPVGANGLPCSKLSDNLDKATGSPAAIRAMKSLVDYKGDYSQEVTY